MSVLEARQVLLSQPRIRFAETGNIPGEDVYAAFGQSFGDRYLVVFFVFKPSEHSAIIISGRDMTANERKRYARE